jgi:hypothetical protein
MDIRFFTFKHIRSHIPKDFSTVSNRRKLGKCARCLSLSVTLSTFFFVSLPLCLSVSLSLYLSFSLSFFLSFCLFALSLFLSLCLSVSQSLCLSIIDEEISTKVTVQFFTNLMLKRSFKFNQKNKAFCLFQKKI